MILLLQKLCFGMALAAISSVFASEQISHPFQGITLTSRAMTVPRRVTQHIVQIDLSAPEISFKLTPHRGPIDTVRQTTLDYLTEQHAQLAVNVHFFVPFPSKEVNANVIGLA